MLTLEEHLEELRGRIIVYVAFLFLFGALAFFFSDEIVRWFVDYYDVQLVSLSIFEAFLVRLKIAFVLGFVLSFPVLLLEAYLFLKDGLLRKEGVTLFVGFLVSSFLMLLGFAVNALFLYGKVIEVFYYFAGTLGVNVLFGINDFVNFFALTGLSVGIILQFPVLIYTLIKLDLLSADLLRENRRLFYVAALIVTGIITPDPSFFSQIILSAILVVFYELTLLFIK
jgi:sec-independent protein translocase protein TatC